MGITPSGPFDIPADRAAAMLIAPNPHGRPSSDVLRPWINGEEIADKWRGNWIIDFTSIESEAIASGYEQPFACCESCGLCAQILQNWWQAVLEI